MPKVYNLERGNNDMWLVESVTYEPPTIEVFWVNVKFTAQFSWYYTGCKKYN